MVVAIQVAQARLSAQRAAEILARRTGRSRREGEEVQADRMKEQPRRRPAERGGDPDHEAQRERAAPLGPLGPVRRAVYAAVGRSLHDTWAVITVLPATAQLSLISLRSRVYSMRTRSPGRAGCRNLADATDSGVTPTARSASLSSTAPG